MMIHSTRGRSRKRVRRELRVDGSSFIRRRTDQSNDSADCAETLLNTRDTLFVCQPLSLSLYLLYASLPRCLDAPSIISSRFTYVFATDNSVWTNLVSFDVRCRVDTSLSFFWRVRITLQLLLLFICWKEIEFVRRTKPILLIARRSRRLRVSFLNIQNRGILFHEEQFNLWKVTLSRLIVSDRSYRSSFSRK